jgi:hypothetical protein
MYTHVSKCENDKKQNNKWAYLMLLVWWKYSKTNLWWWLQNPINLLEIIELYV